MTPWLTIVSSNQYKIAEAQAVLEMPLLTASIDLEEVQSLDVAHVARRKAAAAFDALRRPVLVDDTGLSIEALGGLPGALVTWFLSAIGPAGVINLLREQVNRSAEAMTAIGFADLHGVWTFQGRTHGAIAGAPRGNAGFGFDTIFIPAGQTRTYAEMAPADKSAQSMRSEALRAFKAFLVTSCRVQGET